MLYMEIIAVCSQIHTKHINTLCGQKVELSNVNLVGTELRTNAQSVPRRKQTVFRYIYLRPDTTIVYNSKYYKLIVHGYMFRLLMQPYSGSRNM